MRRFGLLAALLLLAGVLAACSTPPPSPPPNPRAATANADNTTPVVPNLTVQGNSTIYYDVTLPSSVRSSYPLLYVELTKNLNLSLISYSTYYTLASSHNASFFASGNVGLASLTTTAGPAAQSVGVNYNCQGSCVIWPMNGETHVYVGIENAGSTPVNVDLYVYGYDYQDAYETTNDSHLGAIQLDAGSPDSGAIETLGDTDWWTVSTSGSLTFSKVSSPIQLQLSLYDNNGTYLSTFDPSTSSTISVRAGDYLEVSSANGYAGPAGVSRYDLSY